MVTRKDWEGADCPEGTAQGEVVTVALSNVPSHGVCLLGCPVAAQVQLPPTREQQVSGGKEAETGALGNIGKFWEQEKPQADPA